MGANRPYLVGIAGGSCSGKTWLANRLHKLLGKESARLSLDDFYLDLAPLRPEERARVNFDHPRAVDWERFEQVLASFASGREARVPKYNFATHAREPDEPLLAPTPILLVEGLWLFRRAAIRQVLHRKIFLRLPEEVCLERRLGRDVRERGRTEESVREQWARQTGPMHLRYVQPQARWADLVWDCIPEESMIVDLAEKIRKELASCSEQL